MRLYVTRVLLLAGWAPLGKAPDTAVRCLAAPTSCGTDSVHPICASGTGSGVCLHGAGWRPSGQYLLDASDLGSAGRIGEAREVTGAGACPADTVPSDCVCPQSRADLSARDEESDPPTDLTVEVESAVGFTISELCYTTNRAKASEADARAPSGSSWWQGCGGDSGVGFAVACPKGSDAAEVLPAAPGLGACNNDWQPKANCTEIAHDPPLLFDVDVDPSEAFPLTASVREANQL